MPTGRATSDECGAEGNRRAGVHQRILLVDDYRYSLHGLKDCLVAGGFKVETAEDSWLAIKKMKEGLFEVAIIDLDLPPVHGVAMSGWDLVRIFRAFNSGVSIIVVSSEGGPEVRAQAAKLNVSEFLEKPISPSKLKAVVKKLHQ
jgi:two-component system nitrogen regulation response regulator GlnG